MPEFLPSLYTPALFALIAGAAALVLISDWRITLLALAVVYASASVLSTQLVLLEVAGVRLITGLLVVTILGLSSMQVNRGGAGGGEPRSWLRFELPTSWPFRLMATLMAVVVAGYLAADPSLALPGLNGFAALNTSAYMLIVLSLLNLGLTEEPMNTGSALLTLLVGFQLMYVAVEPAYAIVALMAASEFCIALAVSYLVVLQYRAPDEASEI